MNINITKPLLKDVNASLSPSPNSYIHYDKTAYCFYICAMGEQSPSQASCQTDMPCP